MFRVDHIQGKLFYGRRFFRGRRRNTPITHSPTSAEASKNMLATAWAQPVKIVPMIARLRKVAVPRRMHCASGPSIVSGKGLSSSASTSCDKARSKAGRLRAGGFTFCEAERSRSLPVREGCIASHGEALTGDAQPTEQV